MSATSECVPLFVSQLSPRNNSAHQEGTDYTITDHVNSLHSQLCPDPRTLEIFTGLVNHLHAFAREIRPTHAEWATAVEYLTKAGKESTEFKNELVLLSDCLGFSALVDEINHPKPPVSALPSDFVDGD